MKSLQMKKSPRTLIERQARKLLGKLLEATPTTPAPQTVRLHNLFGLSMPAHDALKRAGIDTSYVSSHWYQDLAAADATKIFKPREIQQAIVVGLEERGFDSKTIQLFSKYVRLVKAEFSDTDSTNLSHAGAYWTMDVDVPQAMVDKCPDCLTDEDTRQQESLTEMTGVSGVAPVSEPPLGVMVSPKLKSAKTSAPKSDDYFVARDNAYASRKRKRDLARLRARRGMVSTLRGESNEPTSSR